MYRSWRVRYNVSMSIVLSGIYVIALCVCVACRSSGRDAHVGRWLLWLLDGVLVLIPVSAGVKVAHGPF